MNIYKELIYINHYFYDMKQKLPINKDILTWARTSIGLSIEEVVKKFRKAG